MVRIKSSVGTEIISPQSTNLTKRIRGIGNIAKAKEGRTTAKEIETARAKPERRTSKRTSKTMKSLEKSEEGRLIMIYKRETTEVTTENQTEGETGEPTQTTTIPHGGTRIEGMANIQGENPCTWSPITEAVATLEAATTCLRTVMTTSM